MIYSDKSALDLGSRLSIPISYLSDTEEVHFDRWSNMCKVWFVKPPLDVVVEDMINHFRKGSGSDYSNPTLTKAAKEYHDTKRYIRDVKDALNHALNKNNGDISRLRYTASTRKHNPLVKELREKGVNQPSFHHAEAHSSGLKIAVDSLWGNEIIVKSYDFDGINYSGVLTITLYDHFGLDLLDVDNYGFGTGFTSWYILQHYSLYDGKYKPFITKITFDVPFSGTVR